MPTGRLVVDDAAAQEKQGRALDLLIPQLRRTSVLLWIIWLVLQNANTVQIILT